MTAPLIICLMISAGKIVRRTQSGNRDAAGGFG
jgi:hypothetical protein